MNTKPIEWRESRFGSLNGYVCGLHLFTVHYHGSLMPRGEYQADEKLYRLTSHFPGGKVYKCASMEAGKSGAERLLEQFIKRIAA